MKRVLGSILHTVAVFVWVFSLMSLVMGIALFAKGISEMRFDLGYLWLTLSVTLLGFTGGAFGVVCHLVAAGLSRRRRDPGRCRQCGYDLRGAAHDACPECGTPTT